jgi:hydroxypyruvate isomerase
MKYSLCGGAFKGLDVYAQLRKTKEYGFDGIEYLRWWTIDDLKAARAEIEKTGVVINAVVTQFFNLVDSSKRSEYLDAMKVTIEACRTLGTKSIITQTGSEIEGLPREKHREAMIETLKQCGGLLEGSDIVLEVEPLNGLVNHPGHFLQRSDESVMVIDAVDSPNVKLVFDVYHQQVTEGNVIRNATNYLSRINHYHIADNPGRKQPGTGELNYINILRAIKETGFDGFVGLECGYTIDPAEALQQFKDEVLAKI